MVPAKVASRQIVVYAFTKCYDLVSHDSVHVRNLLQEVHFQPPPNWHRVPFYFIRYPGPLLCFQASRICVTARFIDSRFDFLFLRSKRGKYFLPAKEKERKKEKEKGEKKLRVRGTVNYTRPRTRGSLGRRRICYAFLKANKKLIPGSVYTLHVVKTRQVALALHHTHAN